MQIRCEHCGADIDGSLKYCTNCGAPLPPSSQGSGGQTGPRREPETIEELRQWYIDHHLPPEETTRFFIGKDITERRAFGIYREQDGEFVVYKNKNDGSRAVRYKGPDEKFAVTELLSRLKEEIRSQKSRSSSRIGPTRSTRRASKGSELAAVIMMVGIALFVIVMLIMVITDKSPTRGYYRYNDTDFYYQDTSWYYYDMNYGSWYPAVGSLIPDMGEDYDDYRVYDHRGSDFEDSDYYHESDSDSNSDDYSWDGGDSWDAGGMDFDSDW